MWMAKKVAVFIFYWKRKSIHKGKSVQSPLSQEKPLLNSVSEQDKGGRGGNPSSSPSSSNSVFFAEWSLQEDWTSDSIVQPSGEASSPQY